MRSKAKWTLGAVVILLLGGVVYAGGKTLVDDPNGKKVDARVEEEVLQGLARIAEKYGVEPDDLLRKVVERQMSKRPWRQGRVSLVAGNVHLMLGAEQNTIVFRNKAQWVGARHDQRELVVVAGDEVIGSMQLPKDPGPGDLVFVLFEKDGIRYVDGRRLVGGYVPRDLDPVP